MKLNKLAYVELLLSSYLSICVRSMQSVMNHYNDTTVNTGSTNLSNCNVTRKSNFEGICWCTRLRDIRCSGLTRIPTFVSQSVEFVISGFYMEKQRIESVTGQPFANLKVQKIVLNSNLIGERMGSVAFEGLGEILKELHLADNKIKSMPINMLDKLVELRILHLWANDIQEFPSHYFQNCRNLQELILWGNDLTIISNDVFDGLWNLKKLDLDRNNIKSIGANAFKHLSKLEVIHLGENKLSILTEKMFEHLKMLKVLNLDHNNINMIYSHAFAGLSNLMSLSLNDNNLTHLIGDAFEPVKNLTIIFLHRNILEIMWANTFTHQKFLYLLNLSHNKLSDLPDGLFKQNGRLKIIVADNNRLNTVKRCVFSMKYMHLLNLKTFSLFGNKMSCDCKMSWLVEIHRNASTSVLGTCERSRDSVPPGSYHTAVNKHKFHNNIPHRHHHDNNNNNDMHQSYNGNHHHHHSVYDNDYRHHQQQQPQQHNTHYDSGQYSNLNGDNVKNKDFIFPIIDRNLYRDCPSISSECK